MTTPSDPTHRFSSRVADYVKYRPSYPNALFHHLLTHQYLGHGKIVADLGSGTGLLTRPLLDAGCHVFGIEPNTGMRLAGEQQLCDYPNFTSVNATAETTTLPPASVDLIVAGQAFHWFDRLKTRTEFLRILKPSAPVALIWNDRRVGVTPFLQAYEELLKIYATDYAAVDHRQITDTVIQTFFAPAQVQQYVFPNAQHLDFPALEGRLLSSSYVPSRDDPRAKPMLAHLADIFHQHQINNQVTIEYDTRLYLGKLLE